MSKGIIKNYNVIINGKNFYDQAIDSDIKRYEEIRKLTTGQGEDYKKKLDADPEAIQQIEFVIQLKNVDGMNANGAESVFFLLMLEKIKETRLKVS